MTEVHAIEDALARAEVLTSLAPQLTGEQKEHVLATVVVTAQAIEDVRARAEVLTSLAPQLTGQLLDEALASGRSSKMGALMPEC